MRPEGLTEYRLRASLSYHARRPVVGSALAVVGMSGSGAFMASRCIASAVDLSDEADLFASLLPATTRRLGMIGDVVI